MEDLGLLLGRTWMEEVDAFLADAFLTREE